MTDSDTIAAILKAGRDIPVLVAGLDNTATPESVYPTREHPHLLKHGGKAHNTPLNNTLSARDIKIPKDPKDPHYKDRYTLATYKKNALTLTFRGHRNNQVPRVEWEQFYLHLLPLVLEHPKLLLSEAKLMTENLSKIYRASSDYIGDASLTALQQQALKTKSLCLPLLADNPFEKGQDEADDIEAICLEDLGLNAVPSARIDPDTRRKFDNLKVQYSRNMAYLRELINHTFLRAIYQTSSRQAKLEYKEVQRTHHNDEAAALLANAQHQTVKFTAQHIIDYIAQHCTCANDRAVQTIQMSIDKKIRYKGQPLLDWYQLFIPIVNKYQKAAGKQNLDAAEQKTLWKDHFVKQVNLAELVLIISVRAIHLTDQEVRSIIKFNEAEFNDAALLKLLSKLNSSFEKYEPDKAVMTYLHQHSKTLGFELDFRNPKEQTNDRESRPKDRKTRTPSLPSNKRTRLGDNKSSRFPNTRHKNGTNQNTKTATAATVPTKYQCRRASCKQRGTNTNHAHNKCRFKDDVEPSKTYPNLGTAPLKKDQRTNKNSSQKRSGAPVVPTRTNQNPTKSFSKNGATTPSTTFSDTRTCYICQAKGHIATHCPQKTANKQNAKVKLKANTSFMALWKTSFPTEEEDLCATRIVDAWDEPNYCPMCIQPAAFGHVCRSTDKKIHNSVTKVRQTMSNTTMLNDIIEAHQPHTNSTEANTSTTIDSSFFFHAGGQEDSLELTEIHQHSEQGEQSHDDQEYDEQHHGEDVEDDSDRHTENSEQCSEEHSNSDQSSSDNEPPYYSDSETSDPEY